MCCCCVNAYQATCDYVCYYPHKKPLGVATEGLSISLSHIVLNIKDIYLRTHSLVKTAHALNALGYRTRRGYEWTPQTVAIILRSPFYCGTYRYNYRNESETTFTFKSKNEWVLCSKHHPAIFSDEEYKQIDYWLTKNRRVKSMPSSYQRRNTHIFAGLITCGQCGEIYFATLSRRLASGYRPSIRYLCSGRRQKNHCDNKYLTDISVGNFIFNYISNLIQLKKDFNPRWKESRIRNKLLRSPILDTVKEISPATLHKDYIFATNLSEEAFIQKAAQFLMTASLHK